MYRKIESGSSIGFGTVLTILAVLASVMTVMFLLHAETDESSAKIIDSDRCGDNVTYTYSSDGTLAISGTGVMYDYSDGNAPWLLYRHCITKISIGDGVTSLGKSAFYDCTNLRELTIPITLNSVVYDGSPAFSGCSNIEKVNFTFGTDGCGYGYDADSNMNPWYKNTPWYFSRDSLREVSFAYGIKTIGADAFRDLNITSLTIPDSVVGLGKRTFNNCAKLTDVTYPISLKPFYTAKPTQSTGWKMFPAFEGCMAIQKVTITRGNGVPFDYYDDQIIDGYDSIRIEGKSFYYDKAPWYQNPDLGKTIIISENVDRLGVAMFCDLNIVDITIPDYTLFKYSYDGFYNPAIESIRYCNTLVNIKITKCTVADYDGSSNERLPWGNDDVSDIENFVVAEGVTRLPVTLKLRNVENFVLPNSLVSFGKYTAVHLFSDLKIKHMTIPISLNAVWLDSYPVFGYCEIEQITFTPGDSGYGFNYAQSKGSNCWYQKTPWFYSRDTLKSVVFEDGITRIGSNALRELNLTSVVIPDSVESLGESAFYNCGRLVNLTIPITLDSSSAFVGCNAIDRLRLTAGKTGVGFDYSDNVPIWCSATRKPSTVILDSGITYVGDRTFEGFTFVGTDGSGLQPTGNNLGGRTFSGADGVLYQADGSQSGTSVSTDNHPAQDTDGDTAVQQSDGTSDSGLILGLVSVGICIMIGIGACFGIWRRRAASGSNEN